MLEKLLTEQRNTKTMQLDKMSIHDILQLMNEEDQKVANLVALSIPAIEQAVELVVKSFHNKGRLIYIGAGTSGRLGILDAVECVPTFSTSPSKVQGLIAGGLSAFTQAVEGAEDSEEQGGHDLSEIDLSSKDTVIGIAASGRTPYVIGALKYAKKMGSNCISISCNKNSVISQHAKIAIEVETGSEILTGSTRLKAGTAQKLILNMISTVSMIKIGKVYQNLMVDVKATNAKLVERSKHIIMDATQVDYSTAEQFLIKSNQNVKIAIIMILLKCSYKEAIHKLDLSNGFIRNALSNQN
ncbi:N-acetylmuramic acid 6-phosphate etherase [Terrilactibacillus laevilacticus]|uniref:N-acetylmuramic acid 6-phosphate etherase n=1 Tax=Terrilactibacillus laevilacticus TaxID=1380157 RepID=UPI0011468045|nr:N-acetylmuramic acid 6-phosphate etherase [Terrilactibacillus laevilacticus]